MSARPVCLNRVLVDRHFEGTISEADERRLRVHLPTCAICTERYDRHLLLARIDPEARRERDRIGIGLGFAAEKGSDPASGRPKRNWGRIGLLAGGFTAAAALLLLFVFPPRDRARTDDGFQARGGGHAAVGARFVVYRVAGDGLGPAGETLSARDELAFAYDNPAGKRYLVIFAIDARRRVYWYHPAWTDDAADPAAIDAKRGSVTLGEAVRHPFEPGARIRICALFGDAPTTVKAIERGLEKEPEFARSDERTPDVSALWRDATGTCTAFGVGP